jgi:hypothetical protein
MASFDNAVWWLAYCGLSFKNQLVRDFKHILLGIVALAKGDNSQQCAKPCSRACLKT